ncbi:glycosyltransferase [Rhizobium sp. KVB221]|uniref:Glycosyltransferase n=1 Tax=Rhizobium setariae TaxID=2801340 RepID=A0A937CJC8_9HYPH|nr:glycosyltransferase family 2 protein [Rhizobium setariae]MBL0370970.1 glycosyltransferase [Rhizobium setariae]
MNSWHDNPPLSGAVPSRPLPGEVEVGASLVPVFCGSRRLAYMAGVGCWLGALAWFWVWWFQPGHAEGIVWYVVLSAIMAWITLLPGYFIYMFSGSTAPKPVAHQIVPGRIAMVVTKAPSEPFHIVRKTLGAMLDQIDYDFDVWLADEAPDAQTIAWCQRNGVYISSRQGVEDYHRKAWPRRTRCKEGNLAYFYDHYGYERYDFVAQFDADHVPEITYLREIMRPFADSEVGYVSAPSICDSNADESWSARGRLQAEASMHGCLQIGYNNGWAPLCIGSHYAVRTAALKAVGGLGPELAEDHSTTLIMNAGGWKGVHAVAAIAHGEGPGTFADLAVQEFQWSRSLVMILLRYSGDYIPRLSGKLRFQFIFSQLWYPLFSTFMALMFLLPIIALTTGRNFVNIEYPDFLVHIVPLSLVLVALAFYWRSTGTFRPHDAKILGWEATVFLLARWPWSFFGSLFAVRDVLAGSFVDFRITPKGNKVSAFPPIRVLAPYIVLSGTSAAAALLVSDPGSAQGYYLFAILNSAVYFAVLAVIIIKHASENGLSYFSRANAGGYAAATMALCLSLTGTAVYARGLSGLEAVAHGQDVVTFTETRFAVAGAGQGGSRVKLTHFKIKWHGLH